MSATAEELVVYTKTAIKGLHVHAPTWMPRPDVPIDRLNLSTATHNRLLRAGVTRVAHLADLMTYAPEIVAGLPGLGEKGIREIRDELYEAECGWIR